MNQWLGDMSQPHTWLEGLSLQAVARQTGTPLVIFWETDGTWHRTTVAPKFKEGYALTASKATPIVLLLQSKHYTWFCPPEETSVEQRWLRESPPPQKGALAGAAKNTPGLSAATVSSPSLHSMSCCKKGSLKPASSKKVEKGMQGAGGPALRPSAATSVTPSVHTVQFRSQKKSMGTKNSAAPVTPSVHTMCSPEVKSAPSRPKSWHRMAVGQLWWSCHLCDFKIYKNDGVSTYTDSRRQHLLEKHGPKKRFLP